MTLSVRDKMTKFVVPLIKESKDSLTRQGMQNTRGLLGNFFFERTCKKGKKERILISERAHKQVS